MIDWKKYLYHFSWFLLIVSFFQLFFSVTNGIIDHLLFFNTDGLYMPTLYKSLFIDKDPFSSWEFATAPFFFPNFFFFSLIQAVVRNYLVSAIVTSLIIFVLIILCFIKLSGYIIDAKNLAAKGLIVLTTSIFVVLISQNILLIPLTRRALKK